LFPTGRLLSRRWRVVGWLAGVGMVLAAAGIALAPGPLGGEPGPPVNPLGIPGAENLLRVVEAIGLGAFGLAVFASVASLIVRFRRARQVERQQLKWLSYAAVLVGLAALFQIVLFAIWGDTTVTSSLANGATTGSLACVPVATGIAILRHRLYDIDRLISRTLVYVLLTVVLGLGYAGLVLVLGQLFGGVTGNPPSWAVAAATLGVAALFQPARRRIQQAVDRRFNRRRYDTARTIEAFSVRLRDQLDLDTLIVELVAVVDQTMEPTKAFLWLRPSIVPLRISAVQGRTGRLDSRHDLFADPKPPSDVSACMPCSFGLLPHPRSGMCAQPIGLLELTVTDRYIPLVTAACGTRVARPARTTTLAPDGDGSQLGRRVTPVCGDPLPRWQATKRRGRGSRGRGQQLTRSTRSGPRRTGRSATDRSRSPLCPCRSRTSPCSAPEPAHSPRRRAPSRARRQR
jgi:hypothetical protein